MADKLGKYEISGILGKGAMGTVYDARDPVIDRRVAIKTITLPDPDDHEAQEELARFKREAQAAGRLTHPNIVGVFDYGETDKIAYIVMEFVDGPSLKGMLDKNERFPIEETVRIMEGVLAGLQFSHERGVVHRDIKPANIMLTKGGEVKIADFGIARIESSSMTQAGTIMGTPAYMSPEQFMGHTVDARTDIYSSGVMLYQMLTGERPFEGSMTAIMHKALNTTPPKPSELNFNAPSAFDDVVARAMGKRPEHRYENAAAFAQALRAALTGAPQPAMIDSEATLVSTPRSAAPAPAPAPAPAAAAKPAAAPAGKSKMPLIAAGVVGLLVVGGGAAFMLTGSPKPTQVAVAPATPALPSPIALPPSIALPPPPADTPAATAPAPAVTPPVVAAPVAPPPVVTPPPPPPVVASPAPVVTPPPAVAPTQPAQIASAVPNLAALRAGLSNALAGVTCAQIGGDMPDAGMVSLSGIVSRTNESQIRSLVASNAPGASVAWRVTPFDGPYCEALSAVRTIGPRFAAGGIDLEAALKGPAHKLSDAENIVPRIQIGDFPAYLTVTYFSNDGTMAHLHPTAAERGLDIQGSDGRTQHLKVTQSEANRQFPARSTITIGDVETCRCKPEEVGFQVGEPFGTDMILVVASSAPLFPQLRPAEDTPAAYLRDLQAAVDQAQRKGVRLSARGIVVETQAK